MLLRRKEDSVHFGTEMWRGVFGRAKAKRVIVFGKEIADYMTDILDASPVARLRAGWGNQTIDISRFGADGRLIVLPHLSRFSLFNRPESERAFREALARI